MRETSTIFQVSFKHRLLGGKHAQLADAVITGMMAAVFVAYKPQWLATWSDDLYLYNKKG